MPIPGLYATGVNNSGVPTTGTDSHYTVTAPSASAIPAFISSAQPGAWANNATINATSKWISPAANGNTNVATGNYTYTIKFDLTGLDPTTASISGSWLADNSGTIFLNFLTNSTVNTSQTVAGFANANLRSFTISSGFIAGINTLDFRVNNAGGSNNPSGLRVVTLSGTAANRVPEIDAGSCLAPIAFLIGSGLLVFDRRRRVIPGAPSC